MVAPHPLLVGEILAGQQLHYVRIGIPPQHAKSEWRLALRALPLVPLHVTGFQGTTVYAVTSLQTVPKLMNMRFEVELLGGPDTPLRTDLYILRDDAAAADSRRREARNDAVARWPSRRGVR